MSDIVSRPSNDAYRAGWEHAFSQGYHPETKCQVCGTVSAGNLDKCPVCRSVWLEKRFQNGVYVPEK